MRNIPFKARPGKATLKRRTEKAIWRLTLKRDWALFGRHKKRAKNCAQKLLVLANFIPKVCRCTRQEVKEKLGI